ncbi:aspartate/glutamate racemase family protein [Paenibacillus glycanilyticus]|uniref:Aspartate racemase n=1 Tax=Paenibacillus glycanilyticus TaxID=126569 RepID=A0ABQ6GNT1_9BACL|nr:amino acid racemase [Paenibacillus glycanilyticus]GLX70687.1 aspartate racemase [Paenibacillus glycanilyticus]
MEHGSLGIIGGMGPKATSVFFEKIINKTSADMDQNHINMIILNHTSLPDRTDALRKKEGDLFIDQIAKDIALLHHAGVSNIAIPCNTAHCFYDEMQEMTTIPIINMVTETLKLVADKFGTGSRVGILATDGTLHNGIYSKECEKLKLQLYKPDEEVQQRIMSIIYKKLKKNQHVKPAEIEVIIEHLLSDFGCDCVVIACTELSSIPLRQNIKRYCIDAMDVLVEQSILRSGKRVKTSRRAGA